MRRTGHKGRRARATSSPGLSMFPFLAVLICTIGSLVVLLVVITRQARNQAEHAAVEAALTAQRDAEAQTEMVEWRIEQLQESYGKTLEQVADLRSALGHLEDRTRAIERELLELKRTWEALEQDGGKLQNVALETELEQLRNEIQAAEQALADAEQRAAALQPTFAVVPYQGPNETRRRPMYIECRGDKLVLQPEGVTLRPGDFDGPDGPGNPLAAALRAKREYLLAYGNLDPRQAGEPYPLLIVRPDGIGAYYAARNAMNSWGSEFGYELIESDWLLEFPEPDPHLAEVLRRTVEAARVRQEQLAAAAPRHYGTQRSQVMYRAAPGGGIAIDGPVREPVRPGPMYGHPAGRAMGHPAGHPTDRVAGHPTDRAAGHPTDRVAGHPTGHPGGLRPEGGADGDRALAAATGRQPNDAASDGSAPRAAGVEGPGQGATTHEGAAGEGDSPASGPAVNWNAAPDWERTGGQSPADRAEGNPASSWGAPSASSAEAAPPKLGEWRDPDQLRPMADQKGRGWALPDANRRATPITRAVRIECHPDRLVLRQPAGRDRIVPLPKHTAEALGELVAAVRDVIAGWGIAGRDMYWSPVLEVRVAAGAEDRFHDLQVLLQGSGLTLERL